MNKAEYKPIIGIEVHVELKTKSKMFCGCKNDPFHASKPNIYTCPTCLGLPGALPVPNKKAIEWCILIGKALDCKINEESKFDRKNYFYPDLPKGYQISQYDKPFCKNGKLEITLKEDKDLRFARSLDYARDDGRDARDDKKTIKINRVHMEEDTGKLIHEGDSTLIDFNRSGVPLVEIVTEPDINSSEEAVIYLKKIQQIIRYLEVSDCDMEKGSMRCEINISLRKIPNFKFLISKQIPNSKSQILNKKNNIELPKYKVEVKNINSFKFVKKAIEYEIKRQARILDHGETPVQETRGFNSAKGITYSQRSKEEVHDYRYFPEPDIPPIKFSIFNFQFSKKLPELPEQKIQRFIKQYGLTEYNAQILCAEKKTAQYFEEAVSKLEGCGGVEGFEGKEGAKGIANLIINKKVDITKKTPKQLIDHLRKQKFGKVSDKQTLQVVIATVIGKNPQAVTDYRKGKQQAVQFLIGMVMRETRGRAEVFTVKRMLVDKLKTSY